MSLRQMRYLILFIGLFWLGLWFSQFHNVYGWQVDDWRVFTKGMDTIQNWQNAFVNFVNLLQPYFYLYSYIPLFLNIKVTSLELPLYGSYTETFRGFLAYTLVFHFFLSLVFADY